MFDPAIPPNAAADTTKTLSEHAVSVLQHAILSGELEPGSKLRIHDLMQTYAIGATPLREGLSRLLAEGLVHSMGQRGFRVAPTSREDLQDIILARTLVETEAFALAIAKGDDLWEANIVATLHRLQKYARTTDPSAHEGTLEFDRIHKLFHTSLLAACGSPRLLRLHGNLYDQTYRYRRVLMRRGAFRASAVDDEHQDLADLALARKTDAACAKLRKHLNLTLAITDGEGKI